jgi:uncharacterized protein
MNIHFQSPHDLFEYLSTSGLLDKYGLTRVGVFGSFARMEPYHDIDLLIEDETINWKELEAFRTEFQAQTGEKLDIMVRHFAEPIILNRAMKDIQYAKGN